MSPYEKLQAILLENAKRSAAERPIRQAKERRERIAVSMAQGLLAGDLAQEESRGWYNDNNQVVFAKTAVELADALIEELDREVE